MRAHELRLWMLARCCRDSFLAPKVATKLLTIRLSIVGCVRACTRVRAGAAESLHTYTHT